MLVEGVFWCWLKGRFGGANLLMDGGGVLVEEAFWWRGRFGGGRVSVENMFRWKGVLVERAFVDERGVSVEKCYG